MGETKISWWTGVCAVATLVVFLIEFPFYFVRGAFPGVTEATQLAEWAARNDTNILTCVVLDFVILGLILVFAAGLRDLIRRADAEYEWLGALFFGVTVAYVTLTLVADGLQAATVMDARTAPANGVIMRGMMESMYLMYGSVALFLMAMMMAVAGYAGVASRALPQWTGWVAYVCAIACLAFVPSMYVGEPDPTKFYNPAGWGATGVAAGFPLAGWMVVVGVLLLRKGRVSARRAVAHA